MPWLPWTDPPAWLAAGLRAQLPLVLIAVGLGIQCAGVGLFTLRTRPHVVDFGLEPDVIVKHRQARLDDSPDDMPSLALPITGAHVPRSPQLLPGASREYRGGTHEGVDFSCSRGTPIRAVRAGRVLWAEDGDEPPEGFRSELLDDCRRIGETPEQVLHVLHGRRVVLYHGMVGGRLLTTSYSHLDEVRPGLEPGLEVAEGELLGWAGASGTSHARRNDGWGELHLEVRIDGRPVGEGLPSAQVASLYRRLFAGKGRDD